jgi:hypothetical protein
VAAITASVTPLSAANRMGPLQPARRMPAAAQHLIELISLSLAQLDTVPYIHCCPPCVRTRQMNHRSEPCLAQLLPRFTAKQGQYLAFIHAYTLVLGRPPGRADIQRFFRITPPSVHPRT